MTTGKQEVGHSLTGIANMKIARRRRGEAQFHAALMPHDRA